MECADFEKIEILLPKFSNLQATVLLITPPFTQLNTPYPATAYLKGFLRTRNIAAFQADLGIETILQVLSPAGLTRIFNQISEAGLSLSDNAQRIVALQHDYIRTIAPVMAFLQGRQPTLANTICQGGFLPEAGRFAQLEELDWAFGEMGIQDKAKHLGTLYLEDIGDLIQEAIDPHFGFSRYAERLGRSANSFDELYTELAAPLTFTDTIHLHLLDELCRKVQPRLIAMSVPFPGNLYSAFRAAQWVKSHFPDIKIAMGGGFPNTELRSLSDARVFEFFDFITLDDGEAPIEQLVKYTAGEIPASELKRTLLLRDGVVTYMAGEHISDYKQTECGTPDYSDLPLDKYISVIEIANPMHRLWSDGRWNKLTMAHGCYWGKCTFCDISLDYIKLYEPVAAVLLCDRMEQLIAQTGETGFHFVDEAAPPALMRALALEILKRKLVVTWWTNIRFEKSFTADLCQLLRASGCIAVSGGLEVASDRLLTLIQKGVTVEQVALVTRNFTAAGIMVHAYLMYGFPTQTAQETIDSLEMVRQMFEAGIMQSAYWHQFAMTAHSPVGMYPEKFGVRKEKEVIGTFANNDIVHIDEKGTDHELFSYGLKKALFNYMHGICFETPLQDWFEHKVPRTKVPSDYIENILHKDTWQLLKPEARLLWLGHLPQVSYYTKKKKGQEWEMAQFVFHDRTRTFSIQTEKQYAGWLIDLLKLAAIGAGKPMSFRQAAQSYEAAGLADFELFWYSKPIHTLRENGLLAL